MHWEELQRREVLVHGELSRIRSLLDDARSAQIHLTARLDLQARALDQSSPFRKMTPELVDVPSPERVRALGHEEDALMRDAETLRRRLSVLRPERTTPLLDAIQIATPCTARWSEMVGDHRVRHCLQCNQDVFNLSQLAAAEAEALLREKTGGACFRLWRREDGTVLTQDCPTGYQRKHFRRGLAMVAFGVLLCMGAAYAGFVERHHADERIDRTQQGGAF
jgi:hypothetical protein